MSTYFEPAAGDNRHDRIDQRCANCGAPFQDHYNGKCPTRPAAIGPIAELVKASA